MMHVSWQRVRYTSNTTCTFQGNVFSILNGILVFIVYQVFDSCCLMKIHKPGLCSTVSVRFLDR